MSRLSRYKRTPAVKLPSLRSKAHVKNDDDDDDFLPEKKLPSKSTKLKKNVQLIEKTSTDPLNESVSQYFEKQTDEIRETTTTTVPKTNSALEPNANADTKKPDPDPNAIGFENEKSKKIDREVMKPQFVEKIPLPESGSKSDCQVVCPFCWKKLNSKLQGTTHVKSCAKNLPTTRVIEALELHDKQVQEWEKLGIAYPGFSSGSKSAAPRKKGKSGAPRTRKKGRNNDAELELALALSASLHEEMENRHRKTAELLAENELPLCDEKDESPKNEEHVSADKINANVQSKESKKKDPDLGKAPSCRVRLPKPTKSSVVGRSKSKKILNELPLHKTSENERKRAIGMKLNRIIDSVSCKTSESFYIRDEGEIHSIRIPDRLSQYHDKVR